MLASTLTDYRKPVKLLKMRGDGAPDMFAGARAGS